MLHIGTSAGELTSLYLENYVEFDDKSSEQTKEEGKQIFEGYAKRTEENVAKLFTLINQDDVLHNLIKSTIKEITDMLANRKTVQAIYDKLH